MSIYEFEVLNKKKESVSLKDYEGKVCLVINSATGCGFTPQYKELEALYEKYADKGFMILDFPCNQFANQAPGTDEEIQAFCTSKYDVKFPIFKKIEVNGENAEPLFKYLKNELPFVGVKGHPIKTKLIKTIGKISKTVTDDKDIRWNFTKFLCDRNGNPVERFEPTAPMKEVRKAIEALLNK